MGLWEDLFKLLKLDQQDFMLEGVAIPSCSLQTTSELAISNIFNF